MSECPQITSCEIVLVDDGSTDGTLSLLRELTAEGFTFHSGLKADIHLLEQGTNQGKGSAIRRAIDASTGDLVLVQDADLEYSPSDYPKLFEPILNDYADAVFGSRFVGHPRRALYFWHSVMNRFLTLLSNALFNINLTDMETGYKAVRGELVRNLKLGSKRFGIEPEITARLTRAKARIYEVPIRYFGRTYAEGKKIRWTDGVAALFHILRYGLFDREPFKPGLDQTLSSLDAVSQHIYEPALRKALRQVEATRRRPLRILEVGAGIGSLTRVLLESGEVTATDISAPYIDRLKNRFQNREGFTAELWDATQPAPSEWKPFDLIVAFNVLEHLEGDTDILKKWGELLRPHGSMILLVPNLPKLYSPIDRAVGHYRRYTSKDLEQVVNGASLQPVSTFYCNPLGVFGWYLNGILLQRSSLPNGQLRLYSALKPLLAPIEKTLERFTGLSVVCVAEGSAPGEA